MRLDPISSLLEIITMQGYLTKLYNKEGATPEVQTLTIINLNTYFWRQKATLSNEDPFSRFIEKTNFAMAICPAASRARS